MKPLRTVFLASALLGAQAVPSHAQNAYRELLMYMQQQEMGTQLEAQRANQAAMHDRTMNMITRQCVEQRARQGGTYPCM